MTSISRSLTDLGSSYSGVAPVSGKLHWQASLATVARPAPHSPILRAESTIAKPVSNSLYRSEACPLRTAFRCGAWRAAGKAA